MRRKMKMNMKDFLFAVSILVSGIYAELNEDISLSNGPIRGSPRDSNGILSFKGIPYAEPPIGNLRWSPPVPATEHSETLNATSLGNSCYGFTTPPFPYYTTASEDCLYANVWTPASDASEKLPVMVWIYGGGFQFGSSSNPKYDGSALSQNGVVIVSFNYRLGAFGFLALDELDDEGCKSGNFGLQDQILALSWVQQNIAAFGGDPDNVTIFGQSAGSHSVSLLMASPLSRGTFHNAILESGALWDGVSGPLDSFAQARQQGESLQAKLAVSSVSQMRDLSASTIVNAASWLVITDAKINAFSPSIENYVLPKSPGMVFAAGEQANVHVLGGWVADEELPFITMEIPSLTAAQYDSAAELYFGATKMPEFLSLYPNSTLIERAQSASKLDGDMEIRENTYTALQTQFLLPSKPSIWAYYYTYTSPYSPNAYHTAELPFVFGNLDAGKTLLPPSSQDYAFSQVLMSYWTNFAKRGDPNGEALVEWAPYAGDGTSILDLGNTVGAADYDLSGIQFLTSFREDGILPEEWRNATAAIEPGHS